jgi:hypothetical protein
MATYTDDELQQAASRLREIYDVQTRSERLRTARRFGYESKPESRLRIYRRLTRGKAQPFSRFPATEFLNDYVLRFDQDVLDNDGDEMVLNGKIPPYSFSQNMMIVSVVLIAIRRGSNETTFVETQINVNPFFARDYPERGIKETPKKKRLNPMELLKAYQERIREMFDEPPTEGYERKAFAFTDRGSEILSEAYNEPVPELDKVKLGAAFIPTSARYVDDKRQPFIEQKPTFRPFPKDKRERIVRYVNRAYPQLKRSGRL